MRRTRPETLELVWRAFGITRADDGADPDYRMPKELHQGPVIT